MFVVKQYITNITPQLGMDEYQGKKFQAQNSYIIRVNDA